MQHVDKKAEDVAIRPGTIHPERWFGICENCECWGLEVTLDEAADWVASHRRSGGHTRQIAA